MERPDPRLYQLGWQAFDCPVRTSAPAPSSVPSFHDQAPGRGGGFGDCGAYGGGFPSGRNGPDRAPGGGHVEDHQGGDDPPPADGGLDPPTIRPSGAREVPWKSSPTYQCRNCVVCRFVCCCNICTVCLGRTTGVLAAPNDSGGGAHKGHGSLSDVGR